ncbi:MAG TPA: MFS transporter [Solirubrobacteraceae bacterium]|nr:MFS transporter [Solirubrobacteraceae bacterium]
MSERAALRAMAPFLLAAGAMFAVMYSTQAILPELGREFGVSPARAGLSVSAVIAAVALGGWFWGPLSDRIGRRASLVAASGLIVVPSLLLPLAPSFGTLLALRVLQGLCMPGLLTVGLPYVTEAYSPALGARAMGYYISSLVAGGLVGRVGVALVTAATSWRAALAGVAVLPLVSTVLMRARLPEEPEDGRRREPLTRADLRRVLGNRRLLAAMAAGAGLFFTFVGTFSYVTFRLEAPPFSLGPAVAGLVFCLWALGLVGPVAGRAAERHGWSTVALVCLGLVAAGLLVSLPDALVPAIAGAGLVTFAMFAGATAAQLGVAGATEQDRGLATALYFTAYYAAGGLGGFLPGLAYEAREWRGLVALGLAVVVASALAVAAGRRAR